MRRLADGVVIAAIEAGLDPNEQFPNEALLGVWEDQLNRADPAATLNWPTN